MVKIIGHRGCRSKRGIAENSLAAFWTAINEGADGIELDVFLSSDNVLVVFHDETLENLSSGTGAIGERSLAELKALSLRERPGSEVFTKDKIPTLEQVLDLVENMQAALPEKTLKVCIEIKGSGIAGKLAESIQNRLKNGWTMANFEVRSFDMASLKEMKALMPQLQLGVLFAGGEYPWDISEEELLKELSANKNLFEQLEKTSPNNTVSITFDSLTDRALEIIADIVGVNPDDRKLVLTLWTAGERDPSQLNLMQQKRLFDRLEKDISKESAYITDYPGEVVRLIKSQWQLSQGGPARAKQDSGGFELG